MQVVAKYDNIGKDEFIKIVSEKSNFTQGDIAFILRCIVETFEEAALLEKEMKIYGFGKLKYVKFKPRKAHNPKKNISITVPETTKVVFTLAENIRGVGRLRNLPEDGGIYEE